MPRWNQVFRTGIAAAAALATSIRSSTLFADVPTSAPAPSAWRSPDPAAVQRWRDLRFGMFIHWGPVSQTGKEISWSRGTSTPVAVYDDLYKTFNPTRFNADQWVSVAKSAGMKYVVLTCKHHDGFCLWDSKLTDYKITNTPFKRDVTRELADACHRQGIAFGAYYSVCDWHHPDFPLTSPGGKTKRPTSDIEAYNRYLLGQVRELLTGYGPLVTIWNDVPQQFKGRGVREIEMARDLQPDVLLNNRTGDGGDYDTPEQRVGKFDDQRPWESCMTLSAHNHWAWGGDTDGVKPLKAVVDMLVNCAGRDGNMMLNVGPEPTGVINAAQVDRLREMGTWVAKNGDSVYATRGGPWKPATDGSVVTTRHDRTIYVHVLKWPAPGDTVKLAPLGVPIHAAILLGGGPVKWDQPALDRPVTLTVPAADRSNLDTIVKLDLDGSAMAIRPIDPTKT
jgi:alpha-L-fucosidase